ncbi:hypothetical protein D1P53_004212 [Cryptococcus gattii VGV]|nr:hypothetical protein D1P53_004212 [Cryptococcus gattii VGV]
MTVYTFETEDLQLTRFTSYISNSIPRFYRLDSIAHIQVCRTSPSFKTLGCTSTSALALCKSDEDVDSPNIGKAEIENGTMKRLSFQSSTPEKTIFDGTLSV